jgi:hypothetical protein
MLNSNNWIWRAVTPSRSFDTLLERINPFVSHNRSCANKNFFPAIIALQFFCQSAGYAQASPSTAESAANASQSAVAEQNKAADPDFYQSLDRLNRQILIKDIELERFNINFRSANNVQGRWRGPRYFLTQEGNAAATAAGVLTAVMIRDEVIEHPYNFELNSKGKEIEVRRSTNRVGLEDSIYPQMIGQFLSVYGSSLELCINLFHDAQARSRGFAPKTAVKHVEKISANIKELFSQRQQLIASNTSKIPAAHILLAQAQGNVLQDLCDLALNEYSRFHVGARRFRAFQDSLYIFDIAKNATGAAGNIIGLYATAQPRSTANGPAGILTTMSASLVVAGPIASRFIGKVVGDRTRAKTASLTAQSESTDLRRLKDDRKDLARLISDAQQTSSGEDIFLSKMVELESYNQLSEEDHKRKLDLASAEIRAGTRAATQNVLAGTVVGGSKFGPGIGLLIGGFHFWKRPIQSNIVLCDGNLAYFCGSSLAVLDNARIQIRSELQRHELSKQHLLPGQILSEHMRRLDAIEHQLFTSVDSGSGSGNKGPNQ